jgi:DNA-binding beta-propeller fold protein YncE
MRLLTEPEDLVSDGAHLYLTEHSDVDAIVSLDLATGVVTKLAGGAKEGYANGIGGAARFNVPNGIVIDPSHQFLYVADTNNSAIRKVVIATGEVSTVAGAGAEAGVAASFYWPEDLAIDSKGEHLYISDMMNHQIRAIDLTTNTVSTLAGSTTAGSADGVGSAAAFAMPDSIVIDATDSTLYVADNRNDAIREIDIASGQVKSHPYFGEPDKNGVIRNKALTSMEGLSLDPTGQFLYITQSNGGSIRRLDLVNSTATLLAGNDRDVGFANGPGASALFDFPRGLLLTEGALLVADSSNRQIRKLDLSTNAVTTFAGSNQPAAFNGPRGVTTVGNVLYVTDARGGVIRKVSMETGDTATLADATGAIPTFTEPCGITTDGTHLYVVDGNRNTISRITIATADAKVLAGSKSTAGAADGIGTAATFNAPQGIAIDSNHEHLYVADQGNHLIRKIAIATGQVTTIAGSTESGSVDGVGPAARFNMPADLVVASNGAALYVSDGENNTIRRLDLGSAAVTTLAGRPNSGTLHNDGIGTAAAFSKPWGMATDGTYLYFAGAGDDMIRRLELATNQVTTISGHYAAGFADGSAKDATFDRPEGITLDATGNYLFVCDFTNNLIRRVRVK